MLTLFFTPGPVTDYETARAERPRALRRLLPRLARRRRVPGPLAVRGRLRLARPRPARDRAGRRGGRGILPAGMTPDHLQSCLGRAGRARARRRPRADLRGLPAALRPPARARSPAAGTRLLGGDEQYAQGLARIAELDDPEAIAVLAELIGLASRGRAEHGAETDDFALWAATARFLSDRSGREVYRTALLALRDERRRRAARGARRRSRPRARARARIAALAGAR